MKMLDKLNLRLTEIEAKKVTEIRHEILQEELGRCKISSPGCPYLNSTRICKSIQTTLDEYIPKVLSDIARDN